MLRHLIPLAFLPIGLLLHAQSGPVYHWALDESAGLTAAPVTGTSPGVLQNGVVWDPDGGHHQGAARFDGVDDRIGLGPCDLLNGGTAITLSCWVKPDFVTGMERTLMAKSAASGELTWSVSFVQASALRFRLRTGGAITELTTAPSSLFGGQWYHFVATYDGAQMRLYTNGALMAAASATGAIGIAPQQNASLGATSSGAAPFSGWIDDVRIYDRALSDTEIITLLFETLTTATPEGAAFTTDGGPWRQAFLIDPTGRVLHEPALLHSGTSLPQGTLTAGVYTLCLLSDQGRTVRRFVVP